MIVIGPLTAMESVVIKRVPPFFPDGVFLALSFLEIICFAALLTAALVMRRRTDWHRRLMLGAMLAILGPAWGRILPMADLGQFGGIAIMVVLLVLYIGTAALFDLRVRGKVHPAYYVVALAVIVEGTSPGPLGISPFFIDLAATLTGA
jgi:hypothetical protein